MMVKGEKIEDIDINKKRGLYIYLKHIINYKYDTPLRFEIRFINLQGLMQDAEQKDLIVDKNIFYNMYNNTVPIDKSFIFQFNKDLYKLQFID